MAPGMRSLYFLTDSDSRTSYVIYWLCISRWMERKISILLIKGAQQCTIVYKQNFHCSWNWAKVDWAAKKEQKLNRLQISYYCVQGVGLYVPGVRISLKRKTASLDGPKPRLLGTLTSTPYPCMVQPLGVMDVRTPQKFMLWVSDTHNFRILCYL